MKKKDANLILFISMLIAIVGIVLGIVLETVHGTWSYSNSSTTNPMKGYELLFGNEDIGLKASFTEYIPFVLALLGALVSLFGMLSKKNTKSLSVIGAIFLFLAAIFTWFMPLWVTYTDSAKTIISAANATSKYTGTKYSEALSIGGIILFVCALASALLNTLVFLKIKTKKRK